MILLDRLLIGGLRFVLARLAEAAEAERDDPARVREALLEAQLRLELGELTPAAYRRLERELLARLRAQRGAPAVPGAGDRVTGVEARAWDEQ